MLSWCHFYYYNRKWNRISWIINLRIPKVLRRSTGYEPAWRPRTVRSAVWTHLCHTGEGEVQFDQLHKICGRSGCSRGSAVFAVAPVLHVLLLPGSHPDRQPAPAHSASHPETRRNPSKYLILLFSLSEDVLVSHNLNSFNLSIQIIATYGVKITYLIILLTLSSFKSLSLFSISSKRRLCKI